MPHYAEAARRAEAADAGDGLPNEGDPVPTGLLSPTSTVRPTHLCELVGKQLRHLREARGISAEAAGCHLGASRSKISRIETGEVRVKEDDLYRLLDLYRVDEARERSAVFDLVCRTYNRQWWHDYGDVLDDWFCSYLALEPSARTIRTYERDFVPGLLQTRAYAEAVIRLRYTDETEIQRRADVRMQRQRMLRGRSAPQLWAVVNDAALCQDVGNEEVMCEQIEYLIQATNRLNVQIQVLPIATATRAATGSNSFTILRLPTTGLLDVVYLEQIESALYFSNVNQCDSYKATMDQICIVAKRPDETVPSLRAILARR